MNPYKQPRLFDDLVDVRLEEAKEMSLFGIKFKEMSREQLMVAALLGWQAHQRAVAEAEKTN